MATTSFATDVTIEILKKDPEGNENVYSEEVVKIEVGDTVTWLPTSKGHNVEMISSPNRVNFKVKNNEEVKKLLINQASTTIGAHPTNAWA